MPADGVGRKVTAYCRALWILHPCIFWNMHILKKLLGYIHFYPVFVLKNYARACVHLYQQEPKGIFQRATMFILDGRVINWSLSSLSPKITHMKLLWEWKINIDPKESVTKVQVGGDRGGQIQAPLGFICRRCHETLVPTVGWGRVKERVLKVFKLNRPDFASQLSKASVAQARSIFSPSPANIKYLSRQHYSLDYLDFGSQWGALW